MIAPINLINIFFISANILSSGDRYQVIEDPHDTTSWNNAYILTEENTYNAIFKGPNDSDYYTFTATRGVNAYISVSCLSDIADIEFYNYTSNGNHVYYSSDSIMPSNTPNSSTILVLPGETLRIKTTSTTTGCYYSIRVETNLSNSERAIESLFGNDIKCETYYGSSNLTTIKYKLDNSCNTMIDSIHSIANAYAYAIDYWNQLEKINLTLVTTGQNVLLKAASPSDLSTLYPNDWDSSYMAGITEIKYNFVLFVGYNFKATNVYVRNDATNYDFFTPLVLGGASLYQFYCFNCVHEIGHSLGLRHRYNYNPFNIMNAVLNTGNFLNYKFGDCDLISYDYIWGN